MAVWITTVQHYHTVLEETPAVYHDGRHASGWICPRGGSIRAEHLAEGLGERTDRRIPCTDCAVQHAKDRKGR